MTLWVLAVPELVLAEVVPVAVGEPDVADEVTPSWPVRQKLTYHSWTAVESAGLVQAEEQADEEPE